MSVNVKQFPSRLLALRLLCSIILFCKSVSAAPSSCGCEIENGYHKENRANPGKYDEYSAKRYLEDYYDKVMAEFSNEGALVSYAYQIDLLNKEKEDAVTRNNLELAKFKKQEYKYNISKFHYTQFKDEELRRSFRQLNILGAAKLRNAEFKRLLKIGLKMKHIYSTAKLCPMSNSSIYQSPCDLSTQGLPLDPDITRIMAQPQDSATLAYYWQHWRDVTGKRMRQLYVEHIKLINKAAKLNGFNDYSEMLIDPYESPTFKADMGKIWQIVNKKLYKPLFFYVRYKLRKHPQFKHILKHGPLPAHMMGNMWAQTWINLLPYVAPYPDVKIFDATAALKQKASQCGPGKLEQVLSLFATAEDFFVKTGMLSVKDAYGSKSMIIRPTDGRQVACHASAWDMSDGKDFRIKMCTEVDQAHFQTVHHELGHTQYHKQYKDLPHRHRGGANPGFHEAIGDIIALSAMTPKHLRLLGLMKEEPSKESTLNNLMKLFLAKGAILSYSYLLDLYRWRIYTGEIPTSNLTYNWIKMRGEYQGVAPPLLRSELDFDAGAKHHVASRTPYIRYFFSVILQFQIQKKLCEVAGHKGPLHDCDIYKNKKAGKLLSDIMKRGASLPWQQTLKETIGDAELKPDAIIEYFQPLLDFIKAEQKRVNYSTTLNFNTDDYFDASNEYDASMDITEY